jgi:hypothetical protein
MKFDLLLVALLLLPPQAQISGATVHYVDANNSSPASPYTNWESAASSIQQAVDIAAAGDTILITNGVYDTGGRTIDGSISNRVTVTKAITLRSLNGPGATIIVGRQDPGMTNGAGAMRCVYLTNGAALVGFTLTNGATHALQTAQSDYGGGVYSPGSSAVISNCVLIGNYASEGGGGASGGFLQSCLLVSNWAGSVGGGAYNCALSNCVLRGNFAGDGGGGAYNYSGPGYLPLINCTVMYNRSGRHSGGALGVLGNCVVVSNRATAFGGGALGYITNCTLVGNAAGQGGGTYEGLLQNCIVYNNSAASGSNHIYSTLNNCCTAPLPTSGIGSFTNAPQFIDQAGGNLRLQSNSPCINRGESSLTWGTVDLDGRPRIIGATVDVGAYEYQGAGLGEFNFWLEQHALLTDGSADYADTDEDGMNNWQEWISGTEPTNSLSLLKMLAPSVGASGTTLHWLSVTNRSYSLERATDLGNSSAFQVLATNILGQPGATAYTDTNAPGRAAAFYRIGVQR